MPKSTRKVSWDVVRVVAVLSVAVGHITRQGPLSHPELGPIDVYIPVLFGANTLLVVSAFFICVTVRRGPTGRWLGHKLAKLLPAYFAALIATYLVLNTVAGHFGWYEPTERDLWANLLLIQNFSADFAYVDGSYWTMSAQVLAFVAAALLVPRAWLRGRALTVLLWSLILVPIAVAQFNRATPDALLSRVLFDGLTLHRAALFGAGAVIYLWTKDRVSFRHLIGYCFATVAALEWHTEHTDTPSTIAFGVALAMVVAAAGGPDWNIGPLAKPVTWLGGISLGVYLVHQELGYVLARVLVRLGVGQTGRVVLCLAMAVLLGWALTRTIEGPAYTWLTTGGPARLWRTLGDLPTVPAQPQASSSGGTPLSADAGPRPASQARTAAAGPPTSAPPVPDTT
ncbi:acyltransferase family protein [Actinokineospora guangxiensis]|uniref:Acyltransferase family protein n=1 Tax=Actinokineospora guangxiensis TaxID=1490288 RepID=A0ABW0EKN2_9PSEU